MSFDYYYRGESEEEEVVIQTVDSGRPLSIRITDEESNTVLVNLPEEEIDHIIEGLQAAKKKIKQDHSW